MTTSADLYSILGVLPSAETIVIRAAYKALAQRYHPDKWTGRADEAHRRMAAINEAYRILSDEKLRREYDRSRAAASAGSAAFEEDVKEEAFTDALQEVEERWKVALDIYPDLGGLRSRLATISSSLAFSFVVAMLESRLYEHRSEIATTLEKNFLERYFGTNAVVVEYARSLILAREKGAARRLNQLVDVLGSGVRPELLIDKVEAEFDLKGKRERHSTDSRMRERLAALRQAVRESGYYREAIELAELLGHSVKERHGGLFSNTKVHVSGSNGATQVFNDPPSFVQWAQQL